MGRTGQRHEKRLAVGVVVMGLVALTAACGAGTEQASSPDEGGEVGRVSSPADGLYPGGAAGDAAREASPAKGSGGPAGGSAGTWANRVAVQTRAVIRRGEIALVTKEMNRARTEVDDLLARHGGFLASEDTVNDRAGRPERSVLVLRVPEPAFDLAMDELTDIGRPERADRSSEDVTTEVIDIDTRVATHEASLTRLQGFLRRATNVDDMIRLESEIATRQAELESMKAQQKYLHDQTAMSTITVRLRTPAAPPPPPEEEDDGFVAGLLDGWAALEHVLVVTVTVVGVLLPFAAATALVAVPLWLLVRTVQRQRRTGSPSTATDPVVRDETAG